MTAEGAGIRYTVDGSDPRYSASAQSAVSGGTVTLKSGETLRACASTESKYTSDVAEETYTA